MAHLITKIAEYGIIINNDKFLMLKFSKEANPGEKWIFPGGRLDEGEQAKDGLAREIQEETNLQVKVGKPVDVTIWGDGDDNRYAVFFICKLIGGEIKLSREHQDYKWFSFEDQIEFHDESFRRILQSINKS
jgi:8-oxo-dGTP diphosphatase